MDVRTRVKICGITRLEDARAAVDCGADALGFIFVPDTPRYVGARADLPELLSALDPLAPRIAVCRDAGDAPAALLHQIDAIQIYSGEWPGDQEPRCWIRAFRMRGPDTLIEMERELERARPRALLLDAYCAHQLGGAGERFDWDLAVEVKARFGLPIVLAGGLTPENVGEAIAAVRPYAVDVSSGVEEAPGRKSHERMRAFIRAVRTQ